MGAGDREAKGQLVVDGGVRQAAVLEVVGVVEHIVGDHVAQLPLIAVGVDPVGDGLYLADVLPIVDELVQRDEILGGRNLNREMLDDETRHGQRSQRRTPH